MCGKLRLCVAHGSEYGPRRRACLRDHSFDAVLVSMSQVPMQLIWLTCLPAWFAVATPDDSEAVLLDVGGMKCGGCSAAVKRILGARPEVLVRSTR